VDEVKKFFAKESLLKDPKTVKKYTSGWAIFWIGTSGAASTISSLSSSSTEGDDLLPYVSFPRQRKTTRDTSV
jgi:hypothetical protein